MVRRLSTRDATFETSFQDLLGAKRESDQDVNDVVHAILADVKKRGDMALIEYTRKFDRFDLTQDTLAFNVEEISAARASCDGETLAAMEMAAERIGDFHKRQIPEDLDYVDHAGVRLGYRWKSVAAAGLYVPGGTAAYPSSVLMNALPAKVAGVERVVMVVPTPDGEINPLVLAAAELAGVTEIYRIGGAQAVGALAYGTETIKPVDKIVGPGNAYVAAAKRHVFGTVGIDMIAGPSEILVVADGANDPGWIAADLLSQAEHDRASQSILVTTDEAFADQVCEAVDAQLKTLGRRDTATASWQDFGAVIIVENLEQATGIVDRVAPEHLEVALDDADGFSRTVRNAGSMFLGRYVPEALGDYMAGPNHVLPTARSARFSSGLGVLDFLKRSSFIQCDSEGLSKIGPAAATLARAEGLDAHALSIDIRLNKRAG
ncbi:MAG: histidinol dehydrogenase [Rhodospirillales bacterium]|nr:histidinol dehydrogenase [Rhodospirillales bacterium]